MATATPHVIDLLRRTATTLEQSKTYQWGHMGACNCGFLAMTITRLDKAIIHRRAMSRAGDWTAQLVAYCPTSGLPMDAIITSMLDAGFTLDDLTHLEWLSDPPVLRALPGGKRYLRHNVKADVGLYLKTWADVLETRLLDKIRLPVEQFDTMESIVGA